MCGAYLMVGNVRFVASRLVQTTNVRLFLCKSRLVCCRAGYVFFAVSFNRSEGRNPKLKVPCGAVFRENSPLTCPAPPRTGTPWNESHSQMSRIVLS